MEKTNQTTVSRTKKCPAKKSRGKSEKRPVAKSSHENEKPDLARKFERWLKEHDWRYEWSKRDNSNVYIYRMGVSGVDKVGSVSFRIIVDESLIQSYAYFSREIPVQRINAVVEFLTRANFGLKFGNFEFDYDDNRVRYHLLHVKTEVDAPDMESDVFSHLFRLPSRMLTRYVPGLESVIKRINSPEKAVANCEQDI